MPRLIPIAAIVLLSLPSSASAFGWGMMRGSSTSHYQPIYYSYYYYEPIPIYTAPPMTCVPQATVPMAPAPQQPYPTQPNRPFAPPMPAPASAAPPYMPKTNEPPLSTPMPRISETRSNYQSYYAKPRVTESPSRERCQVTFWNLTSRSVNLNVEGRNYTVDAGRSLKVEPSREFAWHVDSRASQNERVPASESAVDIVIRR